MDPPAAASRSAFRVVLTAVLVLAGLGATRARGTETPANAQPAATPPTGAPASPSPGDTVPEGPPPKPDFNASTSADQIGRVVIPVMVNGQGPFSFALDTGANRTVLTPHLAQLLGLTVTPDEKVMMNGTTGVAEVATALVDRVSAGDVAILDQRLPVASVLTNDIDGVLGVDGLGSKRVLVDFKTGKIEIRNARFEQPIQGAPRLSAQLRFGRLMVVDAYVERTRVKAVIDTGSEYTLGNPALYRALQDPSQAKVPYPPVEVRGQTLDVQPGERWPVVLLKIGNVNAIHFPIVFGRFYIFHLWNLEEQPSVVIGMDLMSRLDELVLDYQRREVQMLVEARREQFIFK
jgi:predicted aspartyl protease